MKKLLFFLTSVVMFGQLSAQDPYKDLGIKDNEIEYLTLSKGRYDEFHGYNEYETVGSAVIDMQTNKIVRFLDKDSVMNEAFYEFDMTTRFLTIDPLAAKYFQLSPYAYCANNPITYIDPDGMQIVGATSDDAKKAQQDINDMFKDKKFDQFRSLIALDKKGTTFNSIDSKALTTALDGVKLSEDEQNLVDQVTSTINSKDVNKVEYADVKGTISEEGTTAVKDHFNNNVKAGTGDMLVRSDNMPAATINALGGTGFNVPTATGSYSIIIEGEGITYDGGRAVTTGHEILGHGVANSNHYDSKSNNTRAIQMDNLVRRVMGITNYRDGSNHAGGVVANPYARPAVIK